MCYCFKEIIIHCSCCHVLLCVIHSCIILCTCILLVTCSYFTCNLLTSCWLVQDLQLYPFPCRYRLWWVPWHVQAAVSAVSFSCFWGCGKHPLPFPSETGYVLKLISQGKDQSIFQQSSKTGNDGDVSLHPGHSLNLLETSTGNELKKIIIIKKMWSERRRTMLMGAGNMLYYVGKSLGMALIFNEVNLSFVVFVLCRWCLLKPKDTIMKVKAWK